MNERSREPISEYLQRKDVQERIQVSITRARNEATVTIKHAANLFGFTENQLRDWEEHGILTPERPDYIEGTKGRRLYNPTELDKLAIIQELMSAGYARGEISSEVYSIWSTARKEQQTLLTSMRSHTSLLEQRGPTSLPIDDFVEYAYKQLFNRYFTPHLLRLLLMAICEDAPDTIAGLILPRFKPQASLQIHNVEDIKQLGESLIGWMEETHTFYSFLVAAPTFRFQSDYRVEPLRMINSEEAEENSSYRTWIVIQRNAKRLRLSDELVKTIQRLLKPLYDNASQWESWFGYGPRYWVDPVANFSSSSNLGDTILTGLADMVVYLGGQTPQGNDRWNFCCILLPKDSSVSQLQQSLIVRAGSPRNPHKVGVKTISPDQYSIALSLRAFQGGHIIYRHDISVEDFTIASRQEEGDILSAIAVPIGSENGEPVAVLYVTSHQADSFSETDKRVLRMIGRIAEELINTYNIRQEASKKISSLIEKPNAIDNAFIDFSSENDFIADVEKILKEAKDYKIYRESLRGNSILADEVSLYSKKEGISETVVSFIAVDMDNLSRLANKYGDTLARSLSRSVGRRIKKRLGESFRRKEDWQCYHIYADRFYLLLKGVPLERAKDEAEKLRQVLRGSYKVDAFRTHMMPPPLPDSLVEVSNITVRLGVTSYTYSKLYELLQGPPYLLLSDVNAIIMRNLDQSLKTEATNADTLRSADVVVYWDIETKRFLQWPPTH